MNRPYRDNEQMMVYEIIELLHWATNSLLRGGLGASQVFLQQAVEKHKALCEKVEVNGE